MSISDSVGFVCTALLGAAWSASIFIPLALFVEWCWTTMPISWRSWMWRLVFLRIAIAMLPISIALPLLPAEMRPITLALDESSSIAPGAADFTTAIASDSSIAHQTSTLTTAILVFWLLGFVVSSLAILCQAIRERRCLRKSSVVTNATIIRSMRELAERIDVACPQLRAADSISGPCLTQNRKRTFLLLPTRWIDHCSTSDLRLAFAHELAHHRRKDLRWNNLIAFFRVFLFFHPFIWIATRRYLVAQELACDAEALSVVKAKPAQLAHLIVQFASTQNSWLASVAMAGAYSQSKERIMSMFNNHGVPSRLSSICVFIVAAIFMVPLSVVAQNNRIRTPMHLQNNYEPQKQSFSPGFGASASAYAGSMSFGGRPGFSRGFSYAHAQVGPMQPYTQKYPSFPQKYQRPNTANPRRKATDQMSARAQALASDAMANSTTSGNSWSKSVSTNLNGRRIDIQETKNRLTLTVSEADGRQQSYTAADLDELEKESPEAAKLYRQATGGSNMHDMQMRHQGMMEQMLHMQREMFRSFPQGVFNQNF